MTLPPLTISPEADDLKNSFCFPFKGFSVVGNYLHCTWETLPSLLMKIHLTLQQIMALNPLKSDLKSQHRLIELVDHLDFLMRTGQITKARVRMQIQLLNPLKSSTFQSLKPHFQNQCLIPKSSPSVRWSWSTTQSPSSGMYTTSPAPSSD